MSIWVDIKPIGPTTWRPILFIRNTSGWRSNGTMTYRRRIRAICFTWEKRMAAKRRPWKRHWFSRPDNAPPGSYEFARLAHIEMERVALRRPRIFEGKT